MPGHNIQDILENADFEAGSTKTAKLFKTPEGYIFGFGNTVPSDAATGWAPGALFIDTNAAEGAQVFRNVGSESSANFDALGEGAAEVAIADAGGFTAETTAEGALQEIYQHLLSAQSCIGLPLNVWREASTFDVGNTAANGGILASDTTPVLDAINGGTDGCQRLLWAATNTDQIVANFVLPPDLDEASDLVLHCRIASGGTTDAVGFTVETFFNEGDTKVSDTTTTNQTTSYTEVTATIAAADVPAGAQTVTIGLTPVAHGTDTLAMSACWLEYTKVLLTA